MFQAKKQQILNEAWRKVAEYNYPDLIHVVVHLVIGACDPPNCVGTSHVEGRENGSRDVGEGSVGDNVEGHFLFQYYQT